MGALYYTDWWTCHRALPKVVRLLVSGEFDSPNSAASVELPGAHACDAVLWKVNAHQTLPVE